MLGGNLILAAGGSGGPAADVVSEYIGTLKIPVRHGNNGSLTTLANFTLDTGSRQGVLGKVARYNKFKEKYPSEYNYNPNLFLVGKISEVGILPKGQSRHTSKLQSLSPTGLYFDENSSDPIPEGRIQIRPELPKNSSDTNVNKATQDTCDYLKAMYGYKSGGDINIVINLNIDIRSYLNIAPGAKPDTPITINNAFIYNELWCDIMQRTSEYADYQYSNFKTKIYHYTRLRTEINKNKLTFKFEGFSFARDPISYAEQYSGSTVLDYITLSDIKILRVDLL